MSDLDKPTGGRLRLLPLRLQGRNMLFSHPIQNLALNPAKLCIIFPGEQGLPLETATPRPQGTASSSASPAPRSSEEEEEEGRYLRWKRYPRGASRRTESGGGTTGGEETLTSRRLRGPAGGRTPPLWCHPGEETRSRCYGVNVRHANFFPGALEALAAATAVGRWLRRRKSIFYLW